MQKKEAECEDVLITCLNKIETVKLKLSRLPKPKGEVEEELSLAINCIKNYLKGVKNTNLIMKNQEKEIERLNEEKERMREKYGEMLQALQMLAYQGDIEDFKKKIDYYKRKPLDQSFLTFVTQELSQNTSNQTLNRAFVLDEEDRGFSQFQNFEENSAKKMIQEELEKVKLQAALRIVDDRDEPFEKKEQAWLDIVYTKNAKEQSDIFNSGRITSSFSSQNLQNLSGISITEQCEPKTKESSKEMTFSGKKIKSMTLLKEKLSKKKSIPKTSVKKVLQTHRELQNIQQSDDKALRRKLNFTHKTNEKECSKRKNIKNLDVLTSKSNKKHLCDRN